MPDQPERAAREDAVVFTAPAGGITPEVLAQLKEKFGVELRIRSDVSAIDRLIGRAVDVVAYDRTHPGYGRVYDRDPNTGHLFLEKVLPAIAETEGGGEFI